MPYNIILVAKSYLSPATTIITINAIMRSTTKTQQTQLNAISKIPTTIKASDPKIIPKTNKITPTINKKIGHPSNPPPEFLPLL